MGKYKDNNVTGGYVDFLECTINIKISLPAKRPYCNFCRYCVYDYGQKRAECFLTKEYLLDHTREIGRECPGNWNRVEPDKELPDVLF